MVDVKKETISGMKWASIERFSVMIMRFIMGIIVARILAPDDYGLVGMLSIFMSISTVIVDSGFGEALIQKQNRTEVDFSTVFLFNLVASLLCYSILFFSAPAIASFFKIPLLCSIARVEALCIILNGLVSVHIARLTIDLNFKALALRAILSTFLSGIVGIICAYNGMGVWALVTQELTMAATNLFFIWIYIKWRPSFSFSMTSIRGLGSYGSKLLGTGILNVVYNNLSTLIVGRFFNAKSVGDYNRGIQFASLPVDTITGILNKVLFPILVQLQDDDKRLVEVYRKYISVTSLFIFFGCVLMAAIAKPLILFLLTDKWYEAILILQIFCFSAMFDHINRINLSLLKVKGRTDLFLKLEIIKKTISTISLFAAIPFGVIGICVARVIYTQIAIVLNTYYTGKFFNLGYFSQIRDFGGFLIVSIISCIPTYLMSFTNMPNIVVLCVGSILAVFIYYVILKNNIYMKECVGILSGKVKPIFKKIFPKHD